MLYLLITLALVFLGVMLGVYFGTRQAVRYAIENYTTNAPTTIPHLQIPVQQQRSLANALARQFEAAANHQGPAEIVIDEQQLNSLVAQAPDLRAYDRHVYLQPDGNDLKAFISLPLDQFKPWQEFARRMGGTNYTGRYLNGIAYLDLSLTNGLLKIAPKKMVLNAKTLPDQFLKQFPWEAITHPINEDTNFQSALQRVESIEVENGKVRIKLKD